MARGNVSAGERGVALVEFALILPILLTLIVGIAEFGLAFKDFLSVSNAAREGARVAASAGNEATADCSVRVHIAESFTALTLSQLDRLEIFQSNSSGDPIPGKINTYTYIGGDPANCSTSWTESVLWDPVTRNTITGPSTQLDIIGIRLIYDHEWITNLGPFGGTWQFDQTTITRLEPEAFGS